MPITFKRAGQEAVALENVSFKGVALDKVTFKRAGHEAVTVFEKITQLATPQNVSANGTMVSWDEVENATSYAVLADGSEIGTVENKTGYTITINNIGDYGSYDIVGGPEAGTYEVGTNKGSHTYHNVTDMGIRPYSSCTISNGTGNFINGEVYGTIHFTSDSTATLTWID